MGQSKGNPAIVLGEAGTVLRLGPSGILRSSECTQIDSDVIAHFIQVVGYLSKSSWRKSKLRIPISPNSVQASFPDLESFVFAAVYFRQLSPEEKLLEDAVERYLRCVDSRVKQTWIEEERKRFDASWMRHVTMPFLVNEFSTLELFQAFAYGAYLIHGPDEDSPKQKKAVEKLARLIESHDQAKILGTLHGGLHDVANHANAIGIVLQQDFAHWTNSNLAPRPNIHWHRQLFSPPVPRVDHSIARQSRNTV